MLRKIAKRAVLMVLILLLGLGLWAWASPWPSVLLIRHMWPVPTAEQVEALEALEPGGVSVQRDVVVNPSDKDARIDVYRPEAAGNAALPTVVWVHGGGFITGSKDGMDTYLTHIAAAGYTVVAAEYTVAPQARYPRPVEQVSAALDFLVAHASQYGIDTGQMALGGDSAGAHIAAQTAMAVSDPTYAAEAGLPRPDLPEGLQAVVLYSGAFDLTLVRETTGVGRWLAESMMWAYTGSKDAASDSRLEWADLPEHVASTFPVSFISTGPGDPLLSHSQSMARSLEAAGADVETLWFPEAPSSIGHEYEMDLRTSEAKASMKSMIAFIRAHLDTSVPLSTPSDSW